jgi:hypothetical protein
MAEKESFLTKLIWSFIKPKVQRDIAKLKNSPEYIELELKAKLAAKELETINKKMDGSYIAAKKAYDDAAKKGYKWKSTPEDMFK